MKAFRANLEKLSFAPQKLRAPTLVIMSMEMLNV